MEVQLQEELRTFELESADEQFCASLIHALKLLKCEKLNLKDEQREAMKAIFQGMDVFLWLPTGFGKSICYQALPIIS